METACSSETLVLTYKSTWRYNPKKPASAVSPNNGLREFVTSDVQFVVLTITVTDAAAPVLCVLNVSESV
jgi:hypothetical protein